jgi:hypothetical protein
MKRIILGVLLGVTLSGLYPSQALAEGPLSEEYITLLRTNLVTQKAAVIVNKMRLSEKEMNAFWPVYNKYQKDLGKVGDEKVELIKDYMAHVEQVDDAQARELTARALAIEEKRLAVIKQYIEAFDQVLSAKQIARFFQLELQMQRMIDLQVAAELPLMK